MTQPFILGVNYWPRRKAMYWWSDFDASEVQDEFALISELGLNMVRIFLLWEDFQPEPNRISHQSLDALTTVCDIAYANKLQLNVTFFTGHMSGPNWAPTWMLDQSKPPNGRSVISGQRVVNQGYRNLYMDKDVLEASRLLLRTVVGTLHQHPGIGIWNLGNEPDIFIQPPTPEVGQRWVRDMRAIIREFDQAHPVTCGIHIDTMFSTQGLRVDQVFAETDIAVMHAYPMYLDWAHHPLDVDLVPFSCALTSALCDKPVLMEEFGGCTAPPGEPSQVWEWQVDGKLRKQFMASEDNFAHYIEAVLPQLVAVGATGALLWSFADYVPQLWDRPPCDQSHHERFFGLVRPDGTLKPHADVIRRFAKTHPTVQPATRTVALEISPDTFYQSPMQHVLALYRQFTNFNAAKELSND